MHIGSNILLNSRRGKKLQFCYNLKIASRTRTNFLLPDTFLSIFHLSHFSVSREKCLTLSTLHLELIRVIKFNENISFSSDTRKANIILQVVFLAY